MSRSILWIGVLLLVLAAGVVACRSGDSPGPPPVAPDAAAAPDPSETEAVESTGPIRGRVIRFDAGEGFLGAVLVPAPYV